MSCTMVHVCVGTYARVARAGFRSLQAAHTGIYRRSDSFTGKYSSRKRAVPMESVVHHGGGQQPLVS